MGGGGEVLFEWMRKRREAARLAQDDADALIFAKGERALNEAKRRQRVGLVSGRAAGRSS